MGIDAELQHWIFRMMFLYFIFIDPLLFAYLKSWVPVTTDIKWGTLNTIPYKHLIKKQHVTSKFCALS